MAPRQKRTWTITLGIITAVVSITVGSFTIFAKTNAYIDKRISTVVDGRVAHDSRLETLQDIKEDVEEIRLILGIMYADNPDYQRAVNIAKGRK